MNLQTELEQAKNELERVTGRRTKLEADLKEANKSLDDLKEKLSKSESAQKQLVDVQGQLKAQEEATKKAKDAQRQAQADLDKVPPLTF